MAAKLEELLMSSKLQVAWDLSTPAADIVAKIREKDLSEIQTLDSKCKDQMVPLAFKLARGLKVIPLVALLLVGRGAVLNSVAKKAADQGVKKLDTMVNTPSAKKVEPTSVSGLVKKVEGYDDSAGGTLVDGMALAHSSSCPSVKFSDKLGKTKSYVEEGGDTAMQGSNLHTKSSSDFDVGAVFEVKHKQLEDWEGGGLGSEHLKDFSKWDESFTTLKLRQDTDDWEEVTPKSRKKSALALALDLRDVEGKLKKTLSSGGAQPDRGGNPRFFGDKSPAMGDDSSPNCEVARKLLECLLVFRPRLSAHAQSPFLPPLLRVAQANNEDFVSLLLDAGALVNDRDADGNTVLHWALRQATTVNKRTAGCHVVPRATQVRVGAFGSMRFQS
jgi:hypothetical protein